MTYCQIMQWCWIKNFFYHDAASVRLGVFSFSQSSVSGYYTVYNTEFLIAQHVSCQNTTPPRLSAEPGLGGFGVHPPDIKHRPLLTLALSAHARLQRGKQTVIWANTSTATFNCASDIERCLKKKNVRTCHHVILRALVFMLVCWFHTLHDTGDYFLWQGLP